MSKYRVNIQAELNNIKVTPYGKTMRPNLHDGLEKLAQKQNSLSDTFDNLLINAGNSNAEVVDARNDTVSNPNVNHATLGDRLNSMQTTINNHLAIPHITYREVTPITKIGVLSSDNNEAILTDDDQVILPTGITRDSDNTRDTVVSGVEVTPITKIGVLSSDNNEAILTDDDQVILPTGITRDSDNTRDTVVSGVKIPDLPTVTPNDDDLVLLESKNGTASTKPTGITRDSDNTRDTVVSGVKIPDLPTVTPNDDDLVLLESKNGTASTKVSELLKPVNTEINVIKNESMKYTEI